MTRAEFDRAFAAFSLSSLMDPDSGISNSKLKNILRAFSCNHNQDLQSFLHNQAITFEKHHRTRTTVYISNFSKKVAGYFSVALSTLVTEDLGEDVVLMLDGHSSDRKFIPCYLIGQLGKSDTISEKIGSFLLDDAMETVRQCHDSLGGRFALLDAVSHPKVIAFYEENLFFPIEDSETDSENIRMIRPFFDL